MSKMTRESETAATTDETTGLPALRTWRSVYLFVAIVFVVYVVLLIALARRFA